MTTKEKMGKFFSNRKKVEILVPNKKKERNHAHLCFFKNFCTLEKIVNFPLLGGKYSCAVFRL